MKNHIAAAMILVIMLVTCTACGKNEQTNMATASTASQVSYTLTHVQSGIISYSAEEFEATGTFEMYSDGTALLHYGQQEISLRWDEENMWSVDNESELHPYSISGLVLTLDYFSEILTFVQK